MKKLSALLALLALLLTVTTGCGKSGMSEAEIAEVYKTLVEASYELNDIYYGDGLPYTADEQVLEALLGYAPSADGYSLYYMPVSADAGYASRADIEAATRAVFTEGMCASLFEIAFSGVSTEDEERVAFARYIEQEGFLTVRVGLAQTALSLGRTYDFSTMTVLIDEPSRLRVQFSSLVDGEPSIPVTLTAIKTEDGWRLDSPTY